VKGVGTKYATYFNLCVINGGRWDFCKIGVLVDQSRWLNDENEHRSQEYQVDVYESVSAADKTASVTITG
jgi:hypothetical protein